MPGVGVGSPWEGEFRAPPRPLPAFSGLESEPCRFREELGKAFLFQAPARPGKGGGVLLFTDGLVSGERKVLPHHHCLHRSL